MTCNITIFTSTINRLNSIWNSAWSEAFSSAPKQSGLVFGSCYSVCGSLGLTNVTGGVPTINIGAASATFTTCGITDYATCLVPIDSLNISIATAVRATGNGLLWPSTGPFVTAPATLSGYLLLTVPVSQTLYKFTEISVSIVLNVNFGSNLVWPPDTASAIYPSVPLYELQYQYSTELTTWMQKNLSRTLQKQLQSNDGVFTCNFPAQTDQTCNVGTTMPGSPCHPCDTCCKCLIEQRCDGSCSDCACVNCSPFGWYITEYLAIIFIVIFIIAWFFWKRRNP
jgi:hypothetical protein